MTIIVGAGMAGLLAGAMLRDEATAILEAQPMLPNNHSALLRFRSNTVGETLGIPFRKVSVLKALHPWRNPVADNLAYSIKANGSARLRSATGASNLMETRYIAPPDLVGRMARKVSCEIRFATAYDGWKTSGEPPIISTIPMPLLMDALGYPRPVEFNWKDNWNFVGQVPNSDAYCTVYDPSPTSEITRVSLTGDQLIAECHQLEEQNQTNVSFRALYLLGLEESRMVRRPSFHKQKYAKILPIDENERRRFIMWATEQYGIYSLGRFATWRPGLLLDDVVNDVRVIQRLISQKASSYPYRLPDPD